jgi:hypothetical protein
LSRASPIGARHRSSVRCALRPETRFRLASIAQPPPDGPSA